MVDTAHQMTEAQGIFLSGEYEALLLHMDAYWQAEIRPGLITVVGLSGDRETAVRTMLASWGDDCRYARIACHEVFVSNETSDPLKAQRALTMRFAWMARSITLLGLSGLTNGLALLIQSEAFGILEATGDLSAASDTFDLMEMLVEGSDQELDPVDEVICRRIIAERQGVVSFLSGQSEIARGHYLTALELVEDSRARLKVSGSIANCDFLLAADEQEQNDAKVATKTVVDECHALQIGGSVLRIAQENLSRMQAGSTELIPYDTLQLKGREPA
jgi:hypothetical protein